MTEESKKGSASMRELQSARLDTQTTTELEPWSDPAQALRPASNDTFRRELSKCLTACASANMDAATRREWLITVRSDLDGVPEDLLIRGCKAARAVADHPSKVLPAIWREIDEPWAARRRHARSISKTVSPPASVTPPEPEYCTPEQAAEILREHGFRPRK